MQGRRFRFIISLLLVLILSTFAWQFTWAVPAGQADDPAIYLPVILRAPYLPGKKGISLAYANCEDITKLKAEWYINFQHVPSAGCPSLDKRFVPVIYNALVANNPVMLTQAITNAKASGWLIGFTEPNLPWNGNTTPLEGAKAWKKIEEAALPLKIKLVSPVPSPHAPYTPSNKTDPYGYTWTWKMVEEYQKLYGKKPHFDALGWNYYLVVFPPNPQDALDFFNARRQEALARGYNIPFWVPEYAGACWHSGTQFPTKNKEMMTLGTQWLKDTPWITRFAWFSNRIKGNELWGLNHQSCSLVNPDTGALMELGVLYAGH